MITDLLRSLADGAETGAICPDPNQLQEGLRVIMRGDALPTEIAALLMGLRVRGEKAVHLHAVVTVMLENAVALPYDAGNEPLFDTCGTGGDYHGTVNISTATALLAAAAGLRVAKHGNRAVSSESGSADVLAALGYKIDCSPESSARMLRELNFAFLFAPIYHPAMKHAAPVRREVRFRSVFNLAGPLSNPARPTHQLLGVSHPELIEPMAQTLKLLGRKRALVVHGANGTDEISLTQVTHGLELKETGELIPFYLDPKTLGVGMSEMADLVAGSPEESAARVGAVLAGESGPIADEINANLGAVLYLAGRESSMRAAFNHAREIQQSGRGLALLERLVTESNRA